MGADLHMSPITSCNISLPDLAEEGGIPKVFNIIFSGQWVSDAAAFRVTTYKWQFGSWLNACFIVFSHVFVHFQLLHIYVSQFNSCRRTSLAIALLERKHALRHSITSGACHLAPLGGRKYVGITKEPTSTNAAMCHTYVITWTCRTLLYHEEMFLNNCMFLVLPQAVERNTLLPAWPLVHRFRPTPSAPGGGATNYK